MMIMLCHAYGWTEQQYKSQSLEFVLKAWQYIDYINNNNHGGPDGKHTD